MIGLTDKNGRELKKGDYIRFPTKWFDHLYGIVYCEGMEEGKVFVILPGTLHNKSKFMFQFLAYRLEIIDEDEVIVNILAGKI